MYDSLDLVTVTEFMHIITTLQEAYYHKAPYMLSYTSIMVLFCNVAQQKMAKLEFKLKAVTHSSEPHIHDQNS